MWLLWAPLFVISIGLLGLSTLRMMRKRLERAHFATRIPTAVVGSVLLILLPMTGGILGGGFAWKRATAHDWERPERIDSIVSSGSTWLKAMVRDQKLSADDMRAQMRMFASEGDQAFFRACELALEKTHHDVTRDELIAAAKNELPRALAEKARPLREAAQLYLFALGILVLVIHSGTLTIVWFVCRKRLTVVT
jgi:hypothetical protein